MARVSLADFTPDTSPRRDAPPSPPSAGSVRLLPVDSIATNPLNARTEADEDPDELARLAGTIAQRGVLQPIVVCAAAAFLEQHPDQREALGTASWVALIGNRRLTATRIATAPTIRALVDTEALGSIDEIMLVENGQRRDLHPLREAEAMGRVRDRDQVSVRDLATRIGRTHTYVVHRLALLKLIPPLRAALEDGTLTFKRARDLGQLDESTQHRIAAAGPPWRTGGNPVSTRIAGPRLPQNDPVAAAHSIRESYSGEQLAELVRLLAGGGDPR